MVLRRSDQHQQYLLEGEEKLADIREEFGQCKELLKKIRGRRIAELRALNQSSDNLDGVSRYLGYISESQRLKSHLKNLQEDLQTVEFLAATQLTSDRIGYYGVADWAEKALAGHKHVIEVISQMSFIGAGLTYSSIFSATRGNLGLMCYAFALFNCGFVLTLATLTLLIWASKRPRQVPISSPRIWSIFLNFFLYISLASVATAICLLNITIIRLHFSKEGQGSSESDLEFNISPYLAGYFALFCAAVTTVMALTALVLHYTANGWSTLVSALVSRPHEKPEQSLGSYTPT